MFARSVLRSARAAPLKQNIPRTPQTTPRAFQRHASSSTGGEAGGLGPSAYAAMAGGVAAVAGGYYYMSSSAAAAAGGGPADPAFKGGEQGFIPLRLKRVEDMNHNTKTFTFALPDGDKQVSGLPVASALVTRFTAEGAEKPTVRPYTPTSDVERRGEMDLVVKRYEGGPMSSHIHGMAVGDELEFKGPIPKYEMPANRHSHVVMIAGGSGVTPMWQVAQHVFKNPEDKTKVTLVFGNVTKEDILLKEKWDELENTYPQRFRAFYVLDDPPKDWEQGKGFISKDLLKTVLPEPKEEGFKIFVCGPPGLYKAISGTKKGAQDQGELDGILKELGYNKDQVFKF